jgi:hypothetical protein
LKTAAFNDVYNKYLVWCKREVATHNHWVRTDRVTWNKINANSMVVRCGCVSNLQRWFLPIFMFFSWRKFCNRIGYIASNEIGIYKRYKFEIGRSWHISSGCTVVVPRFEKCTFRIKFCSYYQFARCVISLVSHIYTQIRIYLSCIV